jgi:hypothetical protein
MRVHTRLRSQTTIPGGTIVCALIVGFQFIAGRLCARLTSQPYLSYVVHHCRVIVLEDNDVLHLHYGGYGIYNTTHQVKAFLVCVRECVVGGGREGRSNVWGSGAG